MMPGADRHHDGVPHADRGPFLADLDGPATPFDREHVDVVVAVAWERTSGWQLRPEESDLARAARRRRQTRDRVAARLVGGMVVRALDRHGTAPSEGLRSIRPLPAGPCLRVGLRPRDARR